MPIIKITVIILADDLAAKLDAQVNLSVYTFTGISGAIATSQDQLGFAKEFHAVSASSSLTPKTII